MPADSLWNPSDPDAGDSGHKVQGYQVQVVENYSESDDDRQLSLITHVAVESAGQHDANALLPAIEALQERGITPEQLLADSLYGSDTNGRPWRNTMCAVIAPAMPGNKKNMHLVDFTLDNQGRISPGPRAMGVTPAPLKQTKRDFSAAFSSTACLECEKFDQCPVEKGYPSCLEKTA